MFIVSNIPLYIRNSYNSIKKRKLNRKMGKNMNRQFTEEEIQMAHKHMQRCSSSQIIRDIQIKRTKGHFLPIRM